MTLLTVVIVTIVTVVTVTVVVTVLIVTVVVAAVVIVTAVIVTVAIVVLVTYFSLKKITSRHPMRCSQGSILRFSQCFKSALKKISLRENLKTESQ